MIPGIIVSILFFSLILIKSADLVVIAIRRISRQTQTRSFVLAAIVLALATSFPELSVGIASAIEGSPSVSLGDITGSNIANIALVSGLAAFISGRVRVRGEYFKHDVWISLVAGVIPFFLLLDNYLSRVDGLILIVVYLAYATSFFRKRYVQIGKEQQEEKSFSYRFLRKFNHIDAAQKREFGKLFVGIALMLFSADMIVKMATQLAEYAHMPEFLIGLVVVAIGTSLPELAFSIRSLEDHEPSMFFGNLLGSTIANSTLVIGIVSVIRPIELVAKSEYTIATASFVVVFLLFWLFVRSKHRLDRIEALGLIIAYLVFVAIEFSIGT